MSGGDKIVNQDTCDAKCSAVNIRVESHAKDIREIQEQSRQDYVSNKEHIKDAMNEHKADHASSETAFAHMVTGMTDIKIEMAKQHSFVKGVAGAVGIIFVLLKVLIPFVMFMANK